MTIRIVRDRYCKFYVRKRSPETKQYMKGSCVCPVLFRKIYNMVGGGIKNKIKIDFVQNLHAYLTGGVQPVYIYIYQYR